MKIDEPQFTLGIEEEYLLVDKETRSLVVDPPKSLLSECEELLGNQVTNEPRVGFGSWYLGQLLNWCQITLMRSKPYA